MSFHNGSLLIQETRLSGNILLLSPSPCPATLMHPLFSTSQGKLPCRCPQRLTPLLLQLFPNYSYNPLLQTNLLGMPNTARGTTSIPGILFNNVKFIHVQVVLNLSQWNMAEFGSCARINVSLFYSSLLVDLIASHASRTPDPFAEPNLPPHRGIFRSRKIKGTDSILASIPELFETDMSIWNQADLTAIRRHIGNGEQGKGSASAETSSAGC